MRRGKVPIQRERFKFVIAEWKFRYGFQVNAESATLVAAGRAATRTPVGRCPPGIRGTLLHP